MIINSKFMFIVTVENKSVSSYFELEVGTNTRQKDLPNTTVDLIIVIEFRQLTFAPIKFNEA